MIIVPFVFFLSYFLYLFRKNGLDVGAYMALLYAVTSFFSVLIYRDTPVGNQTEINIIPTIIYCLLISATIQAFASLKTAIRPFNPNSINIKVFDAIVYVCTISFFFTLILFWADMILRLQSGDFKEMRNELYRGVGLETAQQHLSGPLRTLSALFATLNSMSWVLLPMFFYSISFLKKSLLYNGALLLASASCIFQGIIGIDRSIVFFWILLMGLSFVMFYRYIPRKKKKWILIVFASILALLVLYLFAVTMSRFGDGGADEEGALRSVYSYAGQSFINFCWFWDNFVLPEPNFSGIFPAFHYFVLSEGGGAVDYGRELELQVGYFVNVFYSYLGSWMIYIGQEGMIIMSIIYIILVRISLRYKGELTLGQFIRIFILAIVPTCGIIVYIYTSFMRTIPAIAFFIIANYLSPRLKNKKCNETE